MYLGGFRERKWECVCAFWRVEALLLYEREREKGGGVSIKMKGSGG